MVSLFSQDLPFYEIPESPENYSENHVMARMIEGLGYRYYWATDDLSQKNLDFKPSPDGRTIKETMAHIHALSRTIHHCIMNLEIERSRSEIELNYDQLRAETLDYLYKASQELRHNKTLKLAERNIIFVQGDNKSEFPFWNLINGPIEDAIWHVGQIVSFRRSAGNPYNSNAGLFDGKVKH